MLSYNELCELVEQGIITNVTPERINAASIDITLAETLWVEKTLHYAPVVDLSAKPREYPRFEKLFMGPEGYVAEPGQFLLASSQEKFNLPNDLCADYYLNSSLARAGLNAALAMWCDPGWHGSTLTLELKNWLTYSSLQFRPGMKIGQMVFHRVTPVPDERSYKTIGSYNHSQGPSIR